MHGEHVFGELCEAQHRINTLTEDLNTQTARAEDAEAGIARARQAISKLSAQNGWPEGITTDNIGLVVQYVAAANTLQAIRELVETGELNTDATAAITALLDGAANA